MTEGIGIAAPGARAAQLPWRERWAETTGGQVLLVATFLVLLWVIGGSVATWGPVLVATTLWPARRRLVLATATVAFACRATDHRWAAVMDMATQRGAGAVARSPLLLPAVALASLVACALFSWVAQRARRTLVMRRPVLTLLALNFGLIVVAACAPLTPTVGTCLWAFILIFSGFVWYLAYAVSDRSADVPFAVSFVNHLPFWRAVVSTPVPKVGAFLHKIEAKDAQALARSQIKGVRLLAWTCVLVLAASVLKRLIHDDVPRGPFGWLPTLGAPTLSQALEQHASGHPLSLSMRWITLVSNFFEGLLALSIGGHKMIAAARMAGFCALRNTYRPLQATSIAEYWNRVYYYFKELLAEFFFFPTYLTFFKGHPRLRLFFATMAAAGLGNAVFHFLRDVHYVAVQGLVPALASFETYLVFVTVLSVAIGLSQLGLKRRQRLGIAPRLAPLSWLGMIGFYSLLDIFDTAHELGVGDHVSFLLSLGGLR